jgi:NADH-quinone oxidoreductase subunit L
MSSSTEQMLLWIVLFPMIGAALNGIAGCFFKTDKKLVTGVAIGSVALSLVFALVCFSSLLGLHHDDPAASITYQAYEWFSVQVPFGKDAVTVPVNVRFTMDALSGMMTLMVTGIGLLIHIYSSGYMSDEPSYARFFAYLNLFMASMLILVLSSNLPLMFVGWEGVGLCSYLLIGFWFENPNYAAAGKKAFIVNRIGDFGVLMGMFLLLASTRSFEFAEINAKASTLTDMVNLGAVSLDATTATVAALFLFLGCAGKSAQIPLYVWLPDAMAGPTPVSALIHAATMVTSGVYLCCRLSPVFVQSPTAMAVIAVVGTLTALVAASIALVQNQLKKVLAYSTVSQLGFMFAAVGVGAFSAGIFHVFTHAFFKACLFLGAGSVMHAVHAHGDADFKDIGGMKKWMPYTNITFLISCFAIAGFPLTSGFFSKDAILHGALSAGEYFEFAPWLGTAVFAALVLGAAATAFYMFRLYFLTFTGEFRGGHAHDNHGHDDHGKDDHGKDGHGKGDHGHGKDGHGHAEPHESESAITIPLMVLAGGAALVGFLGMPAWMHLPDFWSEWLHGVVTGIPGAEEHHHDAGSGMTALIAGTVAGLSGIAFAFVKYNNKPWHSPQQLSGVHAFLMDKWRVDEFYDVVIVRPMAFIARISGNVDRIAVDGMTKLAAYAAQGAGFAFTRLQNGVVHAYGAAIAFGMVGLLWWVQYPHAHLDTAFKGDAVHFVAGAGVGYQYQWDFDSDGKPEIDWSTTRDTSYAYDAAALHSVEFKMTQTLAVGRGPFAVRLKPGQGVTLDVRDLGGRWRTNPDVATPPSIRYENGNLMIRPGGTTVRVDRVLVSGDDIAVTPGSIVELGGPDDGGEYTSFQVNGVVTSTLLVKSAFGNTQTLRTDVVFLPLKGGQRAALNTDGTPTRFAQHKEAR